MLSFSNLGSARHPLAAKVKLAAETVRRQEPDLMIDGEMQADTAVLAEALEILLRSARRRKYLDLSSSVFAFRSLATSILRRRHSRAVVRDDPWLIRED